MGQVQSSGASGRYYGEKLGEGGFGAVYKTTKNGQVLALKVINLNTEHDLEEALKEAAVLQRVKGHSNIIQIHSLDYEELTLLIYMEYCDQGDLESYVNRQGLVDINQMLSFFKQLVDAVEFIHWKGIIHRDIKPQNILMKTEGRGKTVLKLADFGIANLAATMGYFYTDIGTRSYMAPEVGSGRYTFSADVYSIGMVFRSVMQSCGGSRKKDEVLNLAKEMVYEDPKLRMKLSDVKKRLHAI